MMARGDKTLSTQPVNQPPAREAVVEAPAKSADEWSRCDAIALAALQGMLAGVGSPHVSLKPVESAQAAYGYAVAFLAVREETKSKSNE